MPESSRRLVRSAKMMYNIYHIKEEETQLTCVVRRSGCCLCGTATVYFRHFTVYTVDLLSRTATIYTVKCIDPTNCTLKVVNL